MATSAGAAIDAPHDGHGAARESHANARVGWQPRTTADLRARLSGLHLALCAVEIPPLDGDERADQRVAVARAIESLYAARAQLLAAMGGAR